mmetsp:Transcript_2635/g.11547  ORF Transcript_2635/g.11547 Transcript_2635/m.11547 type:complete len:80 (+) Transcript_2635:160-399(+)
MLPGAVGVSGSGLWELRGAEAAVCEISEFKDAGLRDLDCFTGWEEVKGYQNRLVCLVAAAVKSGEGFDAGYRWIRSPGI